MSVGVALWMAVFLVGPWVTGAAPAPDGGYVSPASLVGTVGECVGLSW